MKINKLTETNSIEEVKKFFKDRGMTRGNVLQKIKYFEDNNSCGRYDVLLERLHTLWSSLPENKKVTKEKAVEYLSLYGGTQAVKVLEEEGVSITRQGLYKAAKGV